MTRITKIDINARILFYDKIILHFLLFSIHNANARLEASYMYAIKVSFTIMTYR